MTFVEDVVRQIGGGDISAKLFAMMREGLLNGVALPEVQTEAEMATHQLLGCDRFSALLLVYAQAADVERDEAFGPMVANLVQDMADRRLREFASELVETRAPLGAHTCEVK